MATTKIRNPETGEWEKVGIPSGSVKTFNGRNGNVIPEAGDYTAEQVGARPADWMPSAEEVGAMRVYADLSELGLTEATATPEAIVKAMDEDSILLYRASGTADTSAFEAPYPYGLLKVIKSNSYYAAFEYQVMAETGYLRLSNGYYNDSATPRWSGWSAIASVDYVSQNAAPAGYGSFGERLAVYEVKTNDDTDGTKFNEVLETLYSSMADKTSIQIMFCDYPYLSGSYSVGTLWRSSDKYGTLFGESYDGTLVLKRKAAGVWQDFVKLLHTGNKNLITPADIGALSTAGGQMTGTITTTALNFLNASVAAGNWCWLRMNNGSFLWDVGTNTADKNGAFQIRYNGTVTTAYLGSGGDFHASTVYGAVYNDYAEYRQTTEIIEAGRVVVENGDDTLSLATERLQPGAEIVSDTFGFAIGETDNCKTPIAVSGRVLAYTYEDRNSYKPGDAVCAAPGGTVSKMTDEEIMKYPHRIIGTVSAIPDYDTWGTDNVAVNGRIWIKVK